MKTKIIIFSIFIIKLINSPETILSHEQSTHQFLLNQALDLLELQLGPQIYINYDVFEEINNYRGSINYQDKYTLLGGAYAEDETDIVFNVKGPFNWFVSMSHFVEPDHWLNNRHTKHEINFSGHGGPLKLFYNAYSKEFKNAKTASYKIKKYLFDGFKWVKEKGPFKWHHLNWPGIFDYYETGNYTDHHADWLGSWDHNEHDDDAERCQYSYYIIGRVAHLLTDMNVPAHVHCEEHAGVKQYNLILANLTVVAGFVENYEFACEYRGSQNDLVAYWTAENVIEERGGFINPYCNPLGMEPWEYLMFLGAQLTDYFASHRTGGDALNTNFGELESLINSYCPENPVSTEEYFENYDWFWSDGNKLTQMADALIPFCVRYVSGFLYWWLVETGQLYQGGDFPYRLYLNDMNLSGDFYMFRANGYPDLLEPTHPLGIINVANEGPSKPFVIEKCARNVNFVCDGEIVFNPGFRAERGCEYHAFINKSNIKCIDCEQNPLYNRRSETDNDCKINY